MCLITHFIPFCSCSTICSTISVLLLLLLKHVLCRSAFPWGIGVGCVQLPGLPSIPFPVTVLLYAVFWAPPDKASVLTPGLTFPTLCRHVFCKHLQVVALATLCFELSLYHTNINKNNAYMDTWPVKESAVTAKPRKTKFQAGQEKLIQRTMDKPQTWGLENSVQCLMAHYQHWQWCARELRVYFVQAASTGHLRMMPRCWASWLNNVFKFKVHKGVLLISVLAVKCLLSSCHSWAAVNPAITAVSSTILLELKPGTYI